MNINISVQRYNPEIDGHPEWTDYTIPASERMSVLEALMYIYENIEPTLAFRFGCRFNKCGLCAVEINGKPRMGCFTEIKDGMKIGPLSHMPIVRDLVIDRTAYFKALRELQLFIPEQQPAAEPQALIEPEARKRLLHCVECLACNANCASYNFQKNPLAGPYVFVKLAQLHLDPRNTIDRRKQAEALGLKNCLDCGGCSCIHGINLKKDVLGTLLGKE
jgi:succinate dehydrogenase/fumarate reductase iron-sulfur protein